RLSREVELSRCQAVTDVIAEYEGRHRHGYEETRDRGRRIRPEADGPEQRCSKNASRDGAQHIIAALRAHSRKRLRLKCGVNHSLLRPAPPLLTNRSLLFRLTDVTSTWNHKS